VAASDSTTSNAYEKLRDSLLNVGAVLSLAELHGGICGALCASGPQAARTWLDEGLSMDSATDEAFELRTALHDLIPTTDAMLAGNEMEFEPLLPSDSAPLEEQVSALASWCQGFLGGLGFAAPDLDARGKRKDAAGSQVAEICADFVEIGRAGLTDEEADAADQAGFALAELREYVRVGVQLVYEELAERRAAAQRDPRELH
jgi:uncharacterized protein YgfB (UPF0149 family)